MKRRFGLFTCLGLLSLTLTGCGGGGGHKHTWADPTYTWADDYSSCTAERVCTQDSTHKESETVNSSYAVVTPATCEEGLGRYTTNVFENTAFSVQTKDVAIPANHNWGTPTYTWSTDYSTCTAERVCTTDASHKETEKVNSTYTVVTATTCEEEGLGRYTATFANSAFETQIHEVAIDESGHIWGTPTYSWSSDYSTCTAERVCENNATHKETETVDSTYNIDSSNTFDGGTVKYNFSADFENLAFEEQTQVITKTYLGEFPVLNSEKTKVKYGLYPQKNVNDSALVSALNALTTPESNGWYLYNNNYYAKVSATPYRSIYVFDNGVTIVSETTYWFKCEPITWNVLSNNNGEYYILSSVLLDAYCYYNSTSNRTIDGKTIYPNNYEYSDIRTWLNNDFYNSAFALGNTHIQTTTVDNSASTTISSTNSYACSNTQDKVFLPSYQDYINSSYGFSTDRSDFDSARYCKTTDWARARGAYYYTSSGSYQYNGDYWTRSPESINSAVACNIYADGKLGYGDYVNDADPSVRPSLSIKMPSYYYGETPILSEDGRTITYGLYPQTNVNNETLVAALNELTTPESNGWYLYEGEYYAKLSASPHVSSYKFDNGVTIVSGITYWFKCEPITWNVLSNNSGEYYIISSLLLDAHCYYNSKSSRTIDGQTVYANNYKYSDIRTWLNNDFYNSAFALGNSHIQTATVDNSASTTDSSSNRYACANTEDKVFLPSYKDYINSSYGFSTSTDSTNTRYCKTTDWARARGAYYSINASYLYNGYYWTRSPRGDYNDVALLVNYDGGLNSYYVSNADKSVRPGLSIRIA